MKYTITGTSVTDDDMILVEFECSSDEVGAFTGSITATYDTPISEVLERINDTAWNAVTDIIITKKADEERKKKQDRYKPLKAQIDAHIGKEHEVKKPKKDKPGKKK